MQLIHRFLSQVPLATFQRDERGAVAMIFALMVVVLAAAVGGAVDFARQSHANALYRDAVDGAILAAARLKQTGASDEEAIAMANAFMTSARERIRVPADVDFKVAPDGTSIVGTVALAVPSTFLRVIGIASLPVRVKNEARFGVGPDIELSLMLDVTGSMRGSKISDLKVAVEDLIEVVILDPAKSKDTNRRIALAPFSSSVKLNSKQFEAATGLQERGHKGCVVERPGTETYTDAAPATGAFVAPLESVTETGNCEDGREVFPLTNNKGELKKLVKSLETGGATAGHLGTAWAWYLLSPAWATVFDADQRPAPYAALTEKKPNGAPKLRKIAILMTDGEYNTQYTGESATIQARMLCQNMKATGIEVFTVGFALNGSQTVLDTLSGCATSSGHFYVADDGAALKTAFRDIAIKASSLRLSQ